MTLRDIAALLGAVLEGDPSLEIRRVAKIEDAGEGDVTFVANPRYAKHLTATKASAVIIARGADIPPGVTAALLRVDDPYTGFLTVLRAYHPPAPFLPPGIHPGALIAKNARLGRDVRIGANVVVGHGCAVGDRTVILHGTVLGDGVTVGDDSLLHANVTVYGGCRLGNRVVVHSGTVIGSDGFGFAPKADGTFEKIPQMGIAVLEDDVEVGANCAIDRATLGETVIRRGAKLDNLIQVAHNVVIGENTVIAAQAGFAGSTRIGGNCMIGGQAGFNGHITLADRTKVGAQSGVHGSVNEPGTALFGTPAAPLRETMRIHGAMRRLPDALEQVRLLQETVARLQQELDEARRR
jgi:UDP-3-O-[3-hydroxymyristoyl] glucosamine N-acyltransferase